MIVPQRLMDWFHVLKTMNEKNSADRFDHATTDPVDVKTGKSVYIYIKSKIE